MEPWGCRREVARADVLEFLLNLCHPSDILITSQIRFTNYNLLQGSPNVWNFHWVTVVILGRDNDLHIVDNILWKQYCFSWSKNCQQFCQWHQTFCPITGPNFQLNDSGTLSGNNSGTQILSGVLTDSDCLKIGKDRLAYCDFVGRALPLAIMARTGLVGTTWDQLGPLGTTWDHFGLLETPQK